MCLLTIVFVGFLVQGENVEFEWVKNDYYPGRCSLSYNYEWLVQMGQILKILTSSLSYDNINDGEEEEKVYQSFEFIHIGWLDCVFNKANAKFKQLTETNTDTNIMLVSR